MNIQKKIAKTYIQKWLIFIRYLKSWDWRRSLREKDKDKINEVLYGWVPEGFKIIPSLPTYCINKEGKVYNKRNKKFSPIKGTTVKYIEVKGKHRQIEDLLKETFNI